MNKTKIAIQGKGRLSQLSMEYLREKGLFFQEKGTLVLACDNAEVDLLCVRDDDIPQYVESGAADYGIVGENVLLEKDNKTKVLEQLGFAKCSLVLAVPEDSGITKVSELEGGRIATSYPNLLRQFLEKERVNAAIIEIKGSVEVAPSLNLADAVCDLTQTGRTLTENKLIPIATVLESQAVLISSTQEQFNLSQELNSQS